MNHRQKRNTALVITAISVALNDWGGGFFFQLAACLSLFYLAVLAYKTHQHLWITGFGFLAVYNSPFFSGTPYLSRWSFLGLLPLSIATLVYLLVAMFRFEIPDKIVDKWV